MSHPGQDVPFRPRSPSQAKKSQPDREVPARPRNPNQAKKFSKTKTSSKIKKSPTDTGSQEEGELDLKVDFGKLENVDNFLMSL